MSGPGRLAALATRIYGYTLKMYPRPFAATFAAEMSEVFALSAAEAARRGFGPLTRLLLRELGDLPVNLLLQHIYTRRKRIMQLLGYNTEQDLHRIRWIARGLSLLFSAIILATAFLATEITPAPLPNVEPQLEQPIRIVIPAIGVDAPVVQGDDWESLKLGVGHHIGSANPGERSNMVLSAHNDIYGETFRRLPDLQLEDEIVVHTATRAYRYVIKARRIVEPTQVKVMDPTAEPVITLISCYPYLIDTQRIVVVGELAEDVG